jgi:hypothetical protein
MKKSRDVKFVIYQVLYIFVVAVLALKGANLDLQEVISKEKVIEKSYADSLKKYIDSLLALGLVPEINFDTTNKFSTPEELQKKLAEVQQRLVTVQNQISPSMTVTQSSPNLMTSNNPEVQQQEEIKKQEEQIPTENITDAVVKVPQGFTQFTTTTISNSNSAPMEVVGHGTIPPGGSKQFTLGGEGSLTFKVGGVTKSVPVKENGKPKISLQRLVPAGEEISVRKVQSTVGYRVTISDDFPGNLSVNFNGPVSVKQAGENTYDVTLNFINSKTAFDNFTEGKDAPYTVSFQVTVADKLAGHSLKQTGVFQFGEW